MNWNMLFMNLRYRTTSDDVIYCDWAIDSTPLLILIYNANVD